MKLIDAVCPHCGGTLKISADEQSCTCEYCNAKLVLDNETLHIQLNNAEESGYLFEKGMQRAKAESYGNTSPSISSDKPCPNKKSRIWLWVLGWIFVFPLPLTILMIRNERLDKKIRYGIILIAWILYLIIGILGTLRESHDKDIRVDKSISDSNIHVIECSSQLDSSNDSLENGINLTEGNMDVSEELDIADSYAKKIDSMVESNLIFIESFKAQDKNSNHYRTEFRLSAYDSAYGKSYSYNGATVDIIVRKDIFKGYVVRIYTSNTDFEQNIELFKASALSLDEELSNEELQKAIDYLKENKSANGYYFSNLGLVFTSDEMMLEFSDD